MASTTFGMTALDKGNALNKTKTEKDDFYLNLKCKVTRDSTWIMAGTLWSWGVSSTVFRLSKVIVHFVDFTS